MRQDRRGPEDRCAPKHRGRTCHRVRISRVGRDLRQKHARVNTRQYAPSDGLWRGVLTNSIVFLNSPQTFPWKQVVVCLDNPDNPDSPDTGGPEVAV